MGDLLELEHSAKQLARFHTGGADQHRLTLAVGISNRLDHRGVLFAPGLVDAIVLVKTADWTIGWDDIYIETIDVVKLVGLGLGGAGHSGELLVEAKIVLDRDGREGLSFAVNLNTFLGLNRLMETITPAAARHFASGESIDNDYLVVFDDIFDILFVEAVCLEKLRDVMDALRLCIAVLLPRRPSLCLFGIAEPRACYRCRRTP